MTGLASTCSLTSDIKVHDLHVLLAQRPFVGGPPEASQHEVLDLPEVQPPLVMAVKMVGLVLASPKLQILCALAS